MKIVQEQSLLPLYNDDTFRFWKKLGLPVALDLDVLRIIIFQEACVTIVHWVELGVDTAGVKQEVGVDAHIPDVDIANGGIKTIIVP